MRCKFESTNPMKVVNSTYSRFDIVRLHLHREALLRTLLFSLLVNSVSKTHPIYAKMTASTRLLLITAGFLFGTSWIKQVQSAPSGQNSGPGARRKRDTNSVLTDEQKVTILTKHIEYRADTTPTAANMVALVSSYFFNHSMGLQNIIVCFLCLSPSFSFINLFIMSVRKTPHSFVLV